MPTTGDAVVDVHLTPDQATRELHAEARAGLTADPKWLSPKWFYDARGSELFEKITTLPEYYPTRAEREILRARSGDVARMTGARTLVELGSGSSEKTRLLLDALTVHGSLRTFVPLDVSEAALREAVPALARRYRGLMLHGVVGDFTRHVGDLPGEPPRLVAFLGGTIGNLIPEERAEFFASVRGSLSTGEWLLLGTDLVKSTDVLIPAYDDSAGVTAEFNRNILHVLNRELGGNFDVDAFEHVALWNAEQEWIEMRLRAARAMRVRLEALDLDIGFERGEDLRTEVSAKFRRSGVDAELGAAGFEPVAWWTDGDERFALTLAHTT